MTTTKPAFQKGDRLLYLSPVTQKLSPCQVVGRDITGKRKGWSIKLLDTGLGAWADTDRLFTGWENLPAEFWNNVANCKYGIIRTQEVEDFAKLDSLDPVADYGDIDSYIGDEVFGYWTPKTERLSNRDYGSLADEQSAAAPSCPLPSWF